MFKLYTIEEEDFLLLCNAFTTKSDALMAKIIYYMGLNSYEVSDLKIENLDLENKVLKVTENGTLTRYVLIPDNLVKLIEEQVFLVKSLYEDDKKKWKEKNILDWEIYPLFPYIVSMKEDWVLRLPKTKKIIDRTILRVSEILKIKPKVSVTVLRRSCVWNLYKKNRDIGYIQSKLGYSGKSFLNMIRAKLEN